MFLPLFGCRTYYSHNEVEEAWARNTAANRSTTRSPSPSLSSILLTSPKNASAIVNGAAYGVPPAIMAHALMHPVSVGSIHVVHKEAKQIISFDPSKTPKNVDKASVMQSLEAVVAAAGVMPHSFFPPSPRAKSPKKLTVGAFDVETVLAKDPQLTLI